MMVVKIDTAFWCDKDNCKLPAHQCLACLIKHITEARNDLACEMEIESEVLEADCVEDFEDTNDYQGLEAVLNGEAKWYLSRSIAVMEELDGEEGDSPRFEE